MGFKSLKRSFLGATRGTGTSRAGILLLIISTGDIPGGKRIRTQTIKLCVGDSDKEVSSIIAAYRRRKVERGSSRGRGERYGREMKEEGGGREIER